MDMKKVNEIIKKRNEFLDSMTVEERIKYYEKFGLEIFPKDEQKNDEKTLVRKTKK